MPHVDGVTHRWLSAGGLRVHLAEAGPADGEPVLLLHGWPQHWYEWRGLVPALSQRYRMLMPDLRGLGWTEATKNGYEKENLARDQIALLDELGIERVKLIGHDWGGYAGFLMCLLAPERVERFVSANVIHPWPKPDLRAFLNSWRLAYQLPMVLPIIGPRVTRKRGFIKFVLNGAKKGVFTAEELEAFEAPYREPTRSQATAGYYRSFLLHDFPLLLRRHWTRYRSGVPTLMLYGTGDIVVTPASLAGYERYADDMQIEFVPDTGHFVVDAEPDLVARRALEFFEAR
ncbi:MAG TPA: alpha/beta hydrolase [Thermoleophilaceae bacterium]